jgi:hypothetical protein
MLIDAPGIEETPSNNTQVQLTDDNADEIMALINKINR